MGGGENNQAGKLAGTLTDGSHATVAGGENNEASGLGAVVGGGMSNIASGQSATLAGGEANTAGGYRATLAGGYSNQAGGQSATLSGGQYNVASGWGAVVGGGANNQATDNYGTIGGGTTNTAGNVGATVPGGGNNTASGAYSFAAGNRARALHTGAFVWSDRSQDVNFSSTADDQFLIRAAGGVGINTASPIAGGLTVNGRIIAGGVGSPAGSSEPLVARGSNSGLSLDDRNNASLRWVIYANSGLLRFFYTVGGDRATLDGGGLLSVGGLNSSGIVSIGTLGTAGGTSLCRNPSNQVAACSSSRRYKSNVAPLALGLETIGRLRPVTFDWTATGEADLGLVAEEVDQVTPLLTTRNDAGQVEGVKYDRVSALLVKAVQEQQAEIADLQAQNQALEARLAALETRAGRPGDTLAPLGLLALGGLLGLVAARRRGGF